MNLNKMMKDKEKLVSFLIPCYNHEHFVMDLFHSILDQTYEHYEIIICDDCSKDQSVEVIKKAKALFEEKGVRFELLTNEKNQGIVKNLNQMLEIATGEYVKVIASDDILDPYYLERMVELLEENKEAKFAFCNCIRFKEEGHYPVEESYVLGKLLDPFPKESSYTFEEVFRLNMVPAPSTMYRRDVFEEVGRYDESIAIEDLEMLLRVLSRYPKGCVYTEEALVYYRINDNSISSTKRNKGAYKRIRFMYENQLKTAKKYRNDVSNSVYKNRMHDIRLSYYIQLFHLIFG